MKLIIDGETRDVPEGTKVTQALGDVHLIWDVCGCMGLCPDCLNVDGALGCQRRYKTASVVRVQGPVVLEFPDGTEQVFDGATNVVFPPDIVFGDSCCEAGLG